MSVDDVAINYSDIAFSQPTTQVINVKDIGQQFVQSTNPQADNLPNAPQQGRAIQTQPNIAAEADQVGFAVQNQGGILGDIMGAASSLYDDAVDGMKSILPDNEPVVAVAQPDPTPDIQKTYTPEYNTISSGPTGMA